MKIAKKTLQWYWEIIKAPLLFLLLWHLAGLILGPLGIVFIWLGMLVAVGAYCYVGHKTVKKHKGAYVHAGVAGALLGVSLGVIGFVVMTVVLMIPLSLLSGLLLYSPMGMGMMSTSMMMMGYGSAMMGAVMLPLLLVTAVAALLFVAAVGAVFSVLGAFVAKNVE